MTSLRYSFLYLGWLRHRRFTPANNVFKYSVFMVLLDLQELDEAQTISWCFSKAWWSILRFKREDFHGAPSQPLYDAVAARVHAVTGRVPEGRIAVLANLRYLGVQMNPLTTYYCFNAAHTAVDFVVAEVTNTPWGERHAYVLAANPDSEKIQCEFQKDFFVSPFNPMAMRYRWLSTPPGEHLMVHIENWQQVKVMDATLMLERQDFTAANLHHAIIGFPWMTVKVLILIYWQAVKLWFKKVPIHGHGI